MGNGGSGIVILKYYIYHIYNCDNEERHISNDLSQIYCVLYNED